jgi:hypothetical protein
MTNKHYLKGSLSLLAAAAMMASGANVGRKAGKTRDIAYGYRMPAGFAGDINRAHPFSVEPALPDVSAPPLLYGCAVLVNTTTNSVRQMSAGDTGVVRIYGIVSRDFPVQQTQQTSMSTTPGVAVPPTNRALSIMRWGYIMGRVNGAPTKNGAVYVWVAASTGNHVQGTYETAASAGNTAAIVNASFNGPADANGIAEIIVGFTPAG